MAYIYTAQRPEIGIIECVQYKDSDFMIVLSGFFYEKRLSDKIVYPTFYGHGTRAALAKEIILRYKDDIPKLEIGICADGGGNIAKQETGGDLEETIRSILLPDEKSVRCRYDYERDIMYADIWQGVNRTQSQTDSNFVTFSNGFRNIKNVSAKNDSSNYKNYALVGGSGEGDQRIYAEVDLSGGLYKRKIFVDARNEQYDPESQTLDEYRAALAEKGLESLQKYVDISNVEFDAIADSGFRYLEDYDLGDKCDIIIEEMQKSYEARIIEIYETWSRGEHTVTLTFGDKIPTLYERARAK